MRPHLLLLYLNPLRCRLPVITSSVRRYVKGTINGVRNGLNFRPQFLLDPVQVEPVLVCDKVDGKTEVSETPTTADTVKIRFRILREVEVDDDVDGLDIDTTGEKVRADKISAHAITEVVENAITMALKHLGMGVEARVP